MKKKLYFIFLEGPEGVGKSTLLDNLEDLGCQVHENCFSTRKCEKGTRSYFKRCLLKLFLYDVDMVPAKIDDTEVLKTKFAHHMCQTNKHYYKTLFETILSKKTKFLPEYVFFDRSVFTTNYTWEFYNSIFPVEKALKWLSSTIRKLAKEVEVIPVVIELTSSPETVDGVFEIRGHTTMYNDNGVHIIKVDRDEILSFNWFNELKLKQL